LLDGVFDLIHEHLLLHNDFILAQRVKSLFRPKEWLKWLIVFAFNLKVDPVELNFVSIRIRFTFQGGVHICTARFIFFNVLLPLFKFSEFISLPNVRVNVVTHEWQPFCVVVQLVVNFERVCVLKICPNILVIKDQMDLGPFTENLLFLPLCFW
jgi:hypothetical protein